MVQARKTQLFARWLDTLDDVRARARVLVRIERLLAGNAGDTRNVGEGVWELRVDCGPGYRVYYTRQGHTLIILLCGGSKRTQSRDIRRAVQLARSL